MKIILCSINIKNKVTPQKIQERSKRLHILSEKKKRYFYEQNLGKVFNVLFESSSKDKMFGFTENYIKVEHNFDSNLINKIVKIKLDKINENGDIDGVLV